MLSNRQPTRSGRLPSSLAVLDFYGPGALTRDSPGVAVSSATVELSTWLPMEDTLTTDDPASRAPLHSDRGTLSKVPGLGTLTVMAAGALLVPASAIAQGAFGPGAPTAPVAAPRTPPAPPSVTAPQAPVFAPNMGAQPTPMAPSAIAPATPKTTGHPFTITGDRGVITAPSEPKGSGPALTIYGNPSAVTAPSATSAPQKPSSSEGRR